MKTDELTDPSRDVDHRWSVQDVQPCGVPPRGDGAVREIAVGKGGDDAKLVIHASSATGDDGDVCCPAFGSVTKRKFGVGEVLVAGGANDVDSVDLCADEDRLVDGVHVADHGVHSQPEVDRMVQSGIGSNDEIRLFENRGKPAVRGQPTDDDDCSCLFHCAPSAGMTQIRCAGRWWRPPSQPVEPTDSPCVRNECIGRGSVGFIGFRSRDRRTVTW